MAHTRATDFLTHRKKRGNRRRVVWIVAAVLLLFIAVGILWLRQPALALYANASEGRTEFLAAQTALQEQRFSEAHNHLTNAIRAFEDAKTNIAKLSITRIIPGAGRQLDAVDNLLQVGLQAGKAAQSLSVVADRITEPLQKDGDVTFASIPPEKKRDILELVSQAEPDLQGAKADIDLAALYLEKIPEHGLLPPLAAAIKPIREQLPKIQASLEQALPAVRVLPAFVGYPTQKTYLFLLQNNNELRPTGGFIGTYGILKMKDGDVTSLHTDNIYNLDVQAEDFLNLEPPEPLQKYLNSNRWFLRDANWSPDFPTAAKQVLTMFDLEKQAKQNLDGVIAITPSFVQSLMKLTGSITVDGVTFTPDNVIEQLQYQVEIAFVQKGISDAERKDIIGDMTAILFERLLALPKDKWGKLGTALQTNTKEKHVVFYVTDEETESLIGDYGWGGEIRNADGDGFLVIDANLASLKTDEVMRRSIAYSVAPEGNDLIANISITYKHEGGFDWKTTRYRTYTRVYVPLGSELIHHDGYLTNDKLHGGKPADVDVGEEIGKTVFGGFTSIEPGTSETLTLRYKLPAALAERYRNGDYSLLAQKQAGTLGHELTLDVKLLGRIQSHSPEEGVVFEGDHARLSTDLKEDRDFSLHFRP